MVYPLAEMLLLVLCATVAGAEDFVEVARWGRSKIGFLRRFLPYARGIPSHDTLCDVISALDPSLFKEAFTAWVEEPREDEPEIVAIDGKTSRRSHNRARGRGPLHLVPAWASRQRLVLGQEATAEKSNEIGAIPLLLERLALKGALVTIDAMSATAKIAQAIHDREADYLLALKANQRHLFEEAELYFRDAFDADRFETVVGDHGRIETRRHSVSGDVEWLRADRSAPGEPRFPAPATIAMVETQVEAASKTTVARRYYLSSPPPRCQDLRQSRARPLGRGEQPALGARRRLPRRSRPSQNRPWARKHGHRQTHGPQPAQRVSQNRQLQNPTQASRLGRRLPPRRCHTANMSPFKRFPCDAPVR